MEEQHARVRTRRFPSFDLRLDQPDIDDIERATDATIKRASEWICPSCSASVCESRDGCFKCGRAPRAAPDEHTVIQISGTHGEVEDATEKTLQLLWDESQCPFQDMGFSATSAIRAI